METLLLIFTYFFESLLLLAGILPTIFIYVANHQDAVGDVVEWVAAPVSWRQKSNERSRVQISRWLRCCALRKCTC